MSEDMLCYSCSKPKANLTLRKSSLLSGVNLLLCQTCIENKFEPRWTIILSARKNGPDYVRDFIVKRRYLGNEITATELIV
jgi:protein-arginine kinase activator protein McsA